MTADEIKKVEELVNQKILEALPVVTKEMSIEEAKKTGAMALFGEKYGETVRVVNMATIQSSFAVVLMFPIQVLSEASRSFQSQVLLQVFVVLRHLQAAMQEITMRMKRRLLSKHPRCLRPILQIFLSISRSSRKSSRLLRAKMSH